MHGQDEQAKEISKVKAELADLRLGKLKVRFDA